MAQYKIAWLPGDGVGREVMEATRMVLNALALDAEYLYGDIGWECWKSEGNALPQRTKTMLKTTDCALFGTITSKPKREAQAELDPALKGKGLQYFSPIVQLRQEFDLYSNIRPCKAYPGNPLNYKNDIDFVVFRENTEGLYAGVEFHPLPQSVLESLAVHPKMERFKDTPNDEIAITTRIMTQKGCTRILRSAFEYAVKSGRKSVTLVSKPSVLRETGGLFSRVGWQVAKSYPKIDFTITNVDAQCMWLLKNPQNYEVLVAENMFGDILSDLGAQLVGGLGFACTANLGNHYAVFEPTHGSAPVHYGKYKVNPIAMILSAKMMLDWLNEKEQARRLEQAVADTIYEGKVRTYDMGGTDGTLELAEEIIRHL
ncbi:MAG: 3-isopropylmalate dehydrogenase [Acidobacteria bacterium]|nr:MAG: 3-isopropylmalate dehydrogenase [Acidobacteriota bacterium]